MTLTERLTIGVPTVATVSAILMAPRQPRALYVMAHGAGAGMNHRFMEAVASGFGERGIATLRYQFPYMESGSNRPDKPPAARATVRAAAETAARLYPRLPLLAGGKSFGARMTTQAQAEQPLPGIVGLIAFGFPLHPADNPSSGRADHLTDIAAPMLFLQGDRDALADTALLIPTVQSLGERATLHLLAGADHSFHILARSGRTDADVLAEALDTAVGWIDRLGAPGVNGS
jgi:predicted alpha/beta-hydrolase family hydrolase